MSEDSLSGVMSMASSRRYQMMRSDGTRRKKKKQSKTARDLRKRPETQRRRRMHEGPAASCRKPDLERQSLRLQTPTNDAWLTLMVVEEELLA